MGLAPPCLVEVENVGITRAVFNPLMSDFILLSGMCVGHVRAGWRVPWRQLQESGNHLMWVLGTGLLISERAASALSRGAISPAPKSARIVGHAFKHCIKVP